MAIADASGLPIAAHIQSASPHEVTLIEETLDSRFIEDTPERMIGDKVYDSDTLDRHIESYYATELIAPHRANRKKAQKLGRTASPALQTPLESGKTFMNDVSSLSHSRWECKYHVVWIPKYRKKQIIWPTTPVSGASDKGLGSQSRV